MSDLRQKLSDVLAAGHADTALVGVPISWLREIVAAVPAAAESPTLPIVATLTGAMA